MSPLHHCPLPSHWRPGTAGNPTGHLFQETQDQLYGLKVPSMAQCGFYRLWVFNSLRSILAIFCDIWKNAPYMFFKRQFILAYYGVYGWVFLLLSKAGWVGEWDTHEEFLDASGWDRALTVP